MNEVQRAPRLVQPVMAEEERDAAVIVLRVLLRRGEVEERSEDLVRGALEALVTAPQFKRHTTAEGRDQLRLEEAAQKRMGRFQRVSATSRAAALRNYPRSGSQRLDVLHRVAREGERGATRDELVLWLGRSPQSVTPRVKELVDGGWLEMKLDSMGGSVTRRTRTGAAADVLVLSDRARSELRRRGARV